MLLVPIISRVSRILAVTLVAATLTVGVLAASLTAAVRPDP